VHTAHTLAKVKNRMLRPGDAAEPRARVLGEQQIVAEADRLVANTPIEARELIGLYGADPARVSVVPPGVDLERFTPSPGGKASARRELGLAPDAAVVAFVGRIQPLKAPDVLLRAAAQLRNDDPELGRRLVIAVCGGPSGSGLDRPTALIELAGELGLGDTVRFLPPRSRDQLVDLYRAADLVAVPSHNESFGLVAIEAQACGTPVVAAAVGGLVAAVQDGASGALIDGHAPSDWAKVLGSLLADPGRRAELANGAVAHARNFSWNHTACGLLAAYRDALAAHRDRLVACSAGTRCC
jgi:D-inositol-3-phosphate glycosyltransferase